MALGVSATMALCLLFSLVAVAHCNPLEADPATNASSIAIPAAKVHAVPDQQGLLSLPSSADSVGEVPGEEAPVEPVAEPDPDRSHPDSDGEEELTAKKPSPEGQQGDEKTKEQTDDDEDQDEEEKKKTKKDHDEKKKRKKHHGCDGKWKKEEKTKKHHQSNDEEEEEEAKTKKQIHRHHRVEEEKAKKRPHHNKNNNNGDDSDDEDEQEKKAAKRWRKTISMSRFGHGRRSQREEAQTEEVNN